MQQKGALSHGWGDLIEKVETNPAPNNLNLMNSRQVHEGPLIYTQKLKLFNFARFFGFLKSADKELAAALQITAHHVAEDIKEP